MRLSVIIPLYNKESSIVKTIKSILDQDFDDYEIVVVDDGSTDASVQRVCELQTDRMRLLSKPNGGPSSARNYGMEHSLGDWIVFIDADDTFEPGAFSHMFRTIDSNPAYTFFCFNHYLLCDGKRFLFSSAYRPGPVYDNFLSWNAHALMPRAGASVFHSPLIKKHPFKQHLRRYEDAESLFDIMRTVTCYRDPVPVMSYNIETASASAPLSDISNDFIGHLSPTGKTLMEQYALFKLYKEGLKIYPDDMHKLYGRWIFFRPKFLLIGFLKNIMVKLKKA